MLFFFFNDTATTEIYTLSLHDALPISTDLLRRRRRLPWLRPLCSRQESRPRCLFHACGDGQRGHECEGTKREPVHENLPFESRPREANGVPVRPTTPRWSPVVATCIERWG